MLYTPRLIPTADSSMSSVVRSRLTPTTGIHFSKELAENPVVREIQFSGIGRCGRAGSG
jgi:hypothetical protein